MQSSINPKELIEKLRTSFVGSEEVYRHGSCFKLYEVLKVIYPSAVAWYNKDEDHIATCIDGVLYDIGGVVTGDYNPLCKSDRQTKASMYKAKYSMYNVRVCPHCEEAVNYKYEKDV